MNRPRNRNRNNRNRNHNHNHNHNQNNNSYQTQDQNGSHYQPSKTYGRQHINTISYPASVPTTAQVTPGASVSIVLKKDQGTGTETPGVVQDLLTRGNHPRGIKVRLQDGQIGRVQRMLVASSTNAIDDNADVDVDVDVGVGVARSGPFPPLSPDSSPYRLLPQRRRDKVNNRHAPVDSGPDLGRSLPISEGGHPTTTDQVRGRANPVFETANIKCPICGTFEGDETAVSYHVERDHIT